MYVRSDRGLAKWRVTSSSPLCHQAEEERGDALMALPSHDGLGSMRDTPPEHQVCVIAAQQPFVKPRLLAFFFFRLLLSSYPNLPINSSLHQHISLQDAIYMYDNELVAQLLSRGADPSALGDDGRRPVHVAVELNRPALIRLLVQAGASVDQLDANGAAPLHLALINDTEDAAVELLQLGANPNTLVGDDSLTPLDVAG